jgi:beta-lactamase regulating signal transducer with metallopeptidase domain
VNQVLLNRLSALTLISCAAVLLVLLLRPLVRRLGGAGLTYASWLLVPLVLLASAVPQPVQLALPLAAAPVQWVITNAGTLPQLPTERASLWAMLWLAGVLIAALIFAAQQFRFQQRLGRLQSLGDGVQHLASGIFTGPLLIGLLRPKIVLPADFFRRYSALEQTLILAHEKVHLQRRDAAVNLLVTAFQTLFWFNPLLHFAASRVRLDQELACDAAVLEKHPDSRSHYAGAILKAALIESSAPLACHWQSRHPMKERILELTRTPPERARRVAARALLTTLALGACYTAWAASDSVAPTPPRSVQAVAERVAAAVLPVPVAAKSTGSEARVAPSPASTPKPAQALPVRTADMQAPEGADLYKVQFSMLRFEQVSEDKTTRQTADFAIAVRPGETGVVKFMEAPDQCTLSLTVTPQPDQMVFVDLPLQCGGEASSPRLLTRLGAKSSIRIGDAAKFTQVSVVVTQ